MYIKNIKINNKKVIKYKWKGVKKYARRME